MSIDMGQLMLGRFVYVEPVAALDDIRFERIVRGFAQHYEVQNNSTSSFDFERGEGYLQLGRWDAFGYVDGGTVERLRDTPAEIDAPGGNVILMPPRFSGLALRLNIRVVLVFWAFFFGILSWFFRIDAFLCGAGYVLACAATITLVRRSLRAKLHNWLARESWN